MLIETRIILSLSLFLAAWSYRVPETKGGDMNRPDPRRVHSRCGESRARRVVLDTLSSSNPEVIQESTKQASTTARRQLCQDA
jgi:hypothetical protein